MRKFPISLNAKKKDEFKNIYLKKIKCILREDICNFMLSRKDEKVYWELDKFSRKYQINIKKIEKLVENSMIPELENIGWKCQLSFGNTGLFIYSSEKPPVNCWSGN